MNINKASDYIINKVVNGGGRLTTLKLHKLLYYTQAWHLAISGKRIFDEKFQAWIHGPVSRTVYDRFKDKKMLYSDISLDDIEHDISDFDLNQSEIQHIENVLEVYGGFTGTQLEISTHNEDPWIKARKGYKPYERCEIEIDEEIMKEYYKIRLVQ